MGVSPALYRMLGRILGTGFLKLDWVSEEQQADQVMKLMMRGCDTDMQNSEHFLTRTQSPEQNRNR